MQLQCSVMSLPAFDCTSATYRFPELVEQSILLINLVNVLFVTSVSPASQSCVVNI